MKKKHFYCPNCDHEFMLLDTFKIQPEKTFICQNCKENLQPHLSKTIKKYWNVTLYIGIAIGFGLVRLYLIFDDNIIKAMVFGITLSLFLLLFYAWQVKKTTTFKNN